jgi:hypothetical protein
MYCVAAALGEKFEKICKVKTPEQVDKILEAYVNWGRPADLLTNQTV